MKKLNLNLKAVLIISLMGLSSSANCYMVVSRHIDACSKGLFGGVKCNSVSKELVLYEDETGKLQKGWQIDCSGAGTTTCPNHLVYQPSDGTDPVDVQEANVLLMYAMQMVADNEVLSGEYQIVVSVEGESQFRIYKVVWNFSQNNETNVTGDIDVERIQ